MSWLSKEWKRKVFSELELTSTSVVRFWSYLLNITASKKAASCQLLSAAAAKLSPLTCSKEQSTISPCSIITLQMTGLTIIMPSASNMIEPNEKTFAPVSKLQVVNS